MADGIQARIERVERRLDDADERSAALRMELSDRIRALEQTLDVALDRIANYGKRDAGHHTTRARLDSRLQDHEWRVKRLEKKQ